MIHSSDVVRVFLLGQGNTSLKKVKVIKEGWIQSKPLWELKDGDAPLAPGIDPKIRRAEDCYLPLDEVYAASQRARGGMQKT